MRFLLILTGLIIGCEENSSSNSTAGSSYSVEDVGDVVATVNGAPLGSISFSQSASRKSPKDSNSLSLEERKEVLDKLIIEELLYQSALEKGYDKDPKVKKVMVNALLRKEVYDNTKNSDFNDTELQAYFDANKEEFIVPAKVQIYSILIKVNDDRSDTDAKAKAERIYTELKKDAGKFREVASKESENPYKRRGGDVGVVPKEGKPGLDSAIVEKAFSMKVETLSQPFKTRDGWNVIYIPAKREENVRSYEKMKGSVLRKVKNEKLKEKYDSYTENLKGSAQITVDEAALNKVEVKTSKKPSLQMPNGVQLPGGKK
jgi:parvulin-like peptidyl-prolyl isomerase